MSSFFTLVDVLSVSPTLRDDVSVFASEALKISAKLSSAFMVAWLFGMKGAADAGFLMPPLVQ